MDMEILQLIIEFIIALVGGIICKYAVPYIKSFMQNFWVRNAVKAAEKIFTGVGQGSTKKKWVIDFLVSMKVIKLDANGDIPQWCDVLIESSCNELDEIVKAVQSDNEGGES